MVYSCVVFLLCLLRHTSGSNGILAGIQMIETSIGSADELRLLSTTNINSSSLSPTCITDAYLVKNTNHSSMERSIVLKEVTINNATIKTAKKNSSLITMELTMTFPIKQTEEFYAKIILKAVTMKIISFVVKNSTKDFCNNMQCPKDPICYPKMDQANIEMNVKKWKSAGQTPTNSTCQHERTMGAVPAHEGVGKFNIINVAVKMQNAVLDTMLEFEEWSPDLPESFFEGFGNANMTLAGTSLFITYKYDVEKEVNWFFTKEGIINLVLMGVLGFNFLIIIFAVLFCACNRSARAFDMEMWNYAMSQKNKENTDEI